MHAQSLRSVHLLNPSKRYRTTENINLPFRVHAVANEVSKTSVEFKVAVRSQFASKVYAQNVVIKIPVPTNTSGAKIVVTAGRAKYVGSENCLVWKYVAIRSEC